MIVTLWRTQTVVHSNSYKQMQENLVSHEEKTKDAGLTEEGNCIRMKKVLDVRLKTALGRRQREEENREHPSLYLIN